MDFERPSYLESIFNSHQDAKFDPYIRSAFSDVPYHDPWLDRSSHLSSPNEFDPWIHSVSENLPPLTVDGVEMTLDSPTTEAEDIVGRSIDVIYPSSDVVQKKNDVTPSYAVNWSDNVNNYGDAQPSERSRAYFPDARDVFEAAFMHKCATVFKIADRAALVRADLWKILALLLVDERATGVVRWTGEGLAFRVVDCTRLRYLHKIALRRKSVMHRSAFAQRLGSGVALRARNAPSGIYEFTKNPAAFLNMHESDLAAIVQNAAREGKRWAGGRLLPAHLYDHTYCKSW
ncbi:hypothetical protein PFISCL1PPCAC_4663 [Pristionchus fissidentatus]|uniref:ETS domain-containing protein n=1 Tax=Pristionchus fissidentatus TaxID=1538716 RepID=A0AAV5V1E2_9BILA|nr:hypothetical protein PFISCL1PPCAC_4663 [Pristionchus fissidentatus]